MYNTIGKITFDKPADKKDSRYAPSRNGVTKVTGLEVALTDQNGTGDLKTVLLFGMNSYGNVTGTVYIPIAPESIDELCSLLQEAKSKL